MSIPVSVKPWISINCIITYPNGSNLLGSGFMLRFSVQILFEFLIFCLLNPNDRSEEISLMDLFLAWFAKLNI